MKDVLVGKEGTEASALLASRLLLGGRLLSRSSSLICVATIILLSGAMVKPVYAQNVYIAHCAAGCPEGAPRNNDLVIRNLYAVSVNQSNGRSDWVAYRVLADTVGVSSLLPRDWRADPLLEKSLAGAASNGTGQALQPDDVDFSEVSYRISEFNADPVAYGHLVPMSSFAGTPFWADINFTTNQHRIEDGLRRGPWARLDQAINSLAAQHGELFVISGPIYQLDSLTDLQLEPGEDPMTSTSNEPDGFFKVIVTPAGGAAAFSFPAASRQADSHCQFRSSIDLIEEDTGLTLLPRQPSWPTADIAEELNCPAFQDSN